MMRTIDHATLCASAETHRRGWENAAVLDVFDHVIVRASDFEASRRFYELALTQLDFGEPYREEGFVEWEDLGIAVTEDDRPVTRNVHIALAASSREAVDAWWRAMTDAGHPDDGAPGPRPQYSPAYYGAFVRDPGGNSVEAVHHDSPRDDGALIDHLWIGVADLTAAKRFYEMIAAVCGFRMHEGRWTHFYRENVSFTIVDDGRPPTENVHLAFPAPDNETVDEFHRVAVAGGYQENGPPGERPVYHAGYYGAFVLDPDANNVEAVCHNRD